MPDLTSEWLLRDLCYLLNERHLMIIETKDDQDIIYYNDKILTRED